MCAVSLFLCLFTVKTSSFHWFITAKITQKEEGSERKSQKSIFKCKSRQHVQDPTKVARKTISLFFLPIDDTVERQKKTHNAEEASEMYN